MNPGRHRVMKLTRLTLIVLLCAAGGGLAGSDGAARTEQGVDSTPPADIVFLGEHIVTMDPAQPSVEAVAVRGETIARRPPRAGADVVPATGSPRIRATPR